MDASSSVPEGRRTLSLKSVAALSIPYGFVLSTCYLTGYWKPLGLNPFQYANAADLASATIAGIWTALAVVALGGVIGIYGTPSFSLARRVLTDLHAENQPSERKFKWKSVAWAAFVVVTLILTAIALWKGNNFTQILTVGIVVGAIIFARLGRLGILTSKALPPCRCMVGLS